jgi:transcriptional regulator with XRE-family HTH domain
LVHSDYCYVGKRVRQERQKYQMSLNELADATGISASYLSLLENGKTVPSIKVLDKICNFFSVHISVLFQEDDDLGEAFFFPRDRQVEVDVPNDRILRFLLPRGNCRIEPVHMTLQPRERRNEWTVHQGTEFGYVIRGVLEVSLEGHDAIRCSEGDSVIYNSSIKHYWQNLGDSVAEVFLVAFPRIDFRGELQGALRT